MKKIIFTFILITTSIIFADPYTQGKQYLAQGYYQKASAMLATVTDPELIGYARYYQARAGLYFPTPNIILNLSIPTDNPHFTEWQIIRTAAKKLSGEAVPTDAVLASADFFLNTYEYGIAERLYMSVLPESKAYAGLARMALKQGKTQTAKNLTGYLPHTGEKYYLLWQTDPEQRESYQKIICDYFANDPAVVPVLVWNYRTAKSKHDPETMRMYLDLLEQVPSYSYYARFERGLLLAEQHQYRAAVDALELVSTGNYYPAALFWQGKIYADRGNMAKARKIWRQIQTDAPLSFYSLRVYQVTGDVPRVKVPTDNRTEKYSARVQALLNVGDYDNALREMEMNCPQARRALAKALILLQQYDWAIKVAEPLNDPALTYLIGYREYIHAGSRGVDEYLIAAIIREESRFNPDAVSWCNARGLMQLMPSTAAVVCRRLGPGSTHDPADNIRMGAYYFKLLLQEFSSVAKAVMAYNYGPGNVYKLQPNEDIDEYIEDIPVTETRDYVKKVLGSYWAYSVLNNNLEQLSKQKIF